MLVNYFLENSAIRTPNKSALICGEKRWTYKELNDAADKLSLALIRHGAIRQDRVIVFLDSSIETVIALFGILKAGCVFIIVNSSMKAKKINYIINDSGACTLITQTNKARIVNEAIKGTNALKNVIWCSGGKRNIKHDSFMDSDISMYSWETLLKEDHALAPVSRYRYIDQDIATIIYTSGSTGDPKGVVSAHCNVVAAVTSITTYLENREQDIILNTLPLSFDYGLYQILMAFSFGGTVVLEKSFTYPYKVIELIQKECVTGFPIVPTMLAILLQMENLAKFDLSSLRYITNTAAALPVAHIKKIHSIFPTVKIFSMYGLTECKRVSYLPPEYLDSKPDSVGIPIPNEEVFIVDENGKELGPNEVGELVVRGANVMRGYWNAAEETRKTFRPGNILGESLLYSGDLFRRDKEGFLYFVGRKDDMIKSKGERISPKEIENILCEIDGITEASVIGVPDDILGNAVKAFIIKQKNSELTEKEIINYCTSNLEPFMVPKYIVFTEELKKTANGKIDKKILKLTS